MLDVEDLWPFVVLHRGILKASSKQTYIGFNDNAVPVSVSASLRTGNIVDSWDKLFAPTEKKLS